jgi:hypothetical protein
MLSSFVFESDRMSAQEKNSFSVLMLVIIILALCFAGYQAATFFVERLRLQTQKPKVTEVEQVGVLSSTQIPSDHQ